VKPDPVSSRHRRQEEDRRDDAGCEAGHQQAKARLVIQLLAVEETLPTWNRKDRFRSSVLGVRHLIANLLRQTDSTQTATTIFRLRQ